MNIVLVEPEIPANTGNVARLCAVTGTPLHLVRPLGFSVDDRHLKRAGLDYWDMLEIHYYDSIDEVLEKYKELNWNDDRVAEQPLEAVADNRASYYPHKEGLR